MGLRNSSPLTPEGGTHTAQSKSSIAFFQPQTLNFKLQTVLVLGTLYLALFSSCKYSFTGASIPTDVKSFSVDYFSNRASLVQPSLSQVFTEKLKDKFLTNTSLAPVKTNGDMSFEGYISDYNVQPTAIQSGIDQAALNRLTIVVSVKFVNSKNEKQNFETTFSSFTDFDSRKTLTQVESVLIEEITKKIVDDVFNKAVINW
jgi:Lipopolysaccharide-assembly